jgi:phosphoglycerate dehydrogenase-like enzyme
LKLLHTYSAGVDEFVRHPLVTETNVHITTSSGIHGPPISEWVLLSWLASSKHYNMLYEGQKRHEWVASEYSKKRSEDHEGKKVGILGYGGIGRQGTYCTAVSRGDVVFFFL